MKRTQEGRGRLVVVGGSDAGISAALRIRELERAVEVQVVLADAYPNFSICGIPYYIAGEVTHWRNLAHRTRADLEAARIQLTLDARATSIDVSGRRLAIQQADGTQALLDYDALVVGTGAAPVRPPIAGLSGPGALGPSEGVHLLRSMGDTFELTRTLDRLLNSGDASGRPVRALIVGAGYVGLEMAEGLTARGVAVTQVEMLPEVLATVDRELGALIRAELERNGVQVHTSTTVTAIHPLRTGPGPGLAGATREPPGLRVEARDNDDNQFSWPVDLVLVVVGVRPDTDLLVQTGATTGIQGAVEVDDTMATNLPGVWAAGDCVVTHHRLLGVTYLPLGTTAHKQGKVAGENAAGGRARFAGSLGTQVVKVFDLVAARTGLREHEAAAAGYAAGTSQAAPDDHKAYYPGAHPVTIRITGDTATGRLLGAQLVGRHGTEISKRVDTYATALFHGMSVDAISDLDLSYTPPLGSPWDATQSAAQAWIREYGSQSRGSQPAAAGA